MSRYQVEGFHKNKAVAISWSRADQLRDYWRQVKMVVESALSSKDKRFALEVAYRAAFPEASR